MHVSDDIRLGPVVLPASDLWSAGNPSPMDRGVGPLGRVYVFDSVPAAGAANNIAAVQAPGAAGNLVLTAGAGTTVRVGSDQLTTQIVLDVPRSVTLAGTAGAPFTVYGFDQYGQPMSELLAAAGTTKKAFKVVTRISNAVAGTGIQAGAANVFGLPFRLGDIGYMISAYFGGTAISAGTVLVADANPATVSTGDVRGTVPAAADGVKRMVIVFALSALQCGPNATRLAAAGVTQA